MKDELKKLAQVWADASYLSGLEDACEGWSEEQSDAADKVRKQAEAAFLAVLDGVNVSVRR